MPQRLDALTNWLREVLNVESAGAQQTVDFQLTPASTDASFRRYFRLQVSQAQLGHLHMPQRENPADSPVTLIAMDAPPDKEETAPFVRIANLLVGIGLNAPRVLAQNTQQGFLLLSDLGTQAYLDVLNEDTVETLYADALNALWLMQRDAPCDTLDGTILLPLYDEPLLRREMALFSEWYCEKYCKLSFSTAQHSGLEAVFQQLCDAALAQPQVFVHRDYHSRNLMRVSENNPGVLDFQDAVIGPITYDLVSLLRDCYIAWPRARVERWALDYLRHAADTDLIHRETDATWLRWFDWMGVQRHLKAVGIFARLYLRDGKAGYLNDIPRTLNYIRDVSARYPELQPLHALLDDLPQ